MHSETNSRHQDGYILMSLIGLLSFISIATLTVFNRSITDIHILQAERNIVHGFAIVENQLIKAEQALIDGVLRNDLVQIEVFQPKGFRKRAGTETTHYKLTATEHRHQTNIQIQTIIRIHEKSSTSKNSTSHNRTLERISWKTI